MKNKSKQLLLQHNAQQYDAYKGEQPQHHSEGNPLPQRVQNTNTQKPGHKAKMSGLNQSMDAGINNYSTGGFVPTESGQKLYIQGQDQYHQNYVSNTFDKTNEGDVILTSQSGAKPTHFRSGSHIVGGGGQQVLKGAKKYPHNDQMQDLLRKQQNLLKMAENGQGELSQAQLAQIAYIQNQQDTAGPISSESAQMRAQQQKAKRKHNMSQNMQMMYHDNPPAKQGHQQSFIMPPDGRQLSSKRSYENTQNFEGNKKGTRKTSKQNMQQNQQNQNQFESARYNSIGALHGNATQIAGSGGLVLNGQPSSQSKERFQGTQQVGKKGNKISGGQGGSIILPAGAGMQGVPQLKTQLSKGHQTHQNKSSQQMPLNQSINVQGGGQQHQRINSDSNSISANMQRGFNSASNAAIQQQAQIVQIYQQQNPINMTTNSTQSMSKMKYHTNNSRKVIPMLQQNQVNQVVSHHKRTTQHLQQLSRDRESKALGEGSQSKLVVDSYPQQNYQTYSLNYNSQPSQQLQGVNLRKGQVADTSRANRVASREQAQRRQMIAGNDMNSVKVINGELSSSYNQGNSQGLTIPQKKQKSLQAQKLKGQHAHNASFNHISSNQGSFNQTSTQGFFNDGSTNQSNQTKASGGTNSKHHQKNNSQYTPQMTVSLKHTINSNINDPQNMNIHNLENIQLQTKKSGPIPQQSHMRQASVQVQVDPNHNKKMSVQHRKNKSVLSNQIRINPALQNQGPSTKMRVSQDNTSGKQKINQYFDNYTDQMQANFYMQQLQNQQSNLSVTQNVQQLKGSSTNLSNASLKHNLSQSTHRKTKTSVIGSGPQKMLGINSSSAFQHPSTLITGENPHSSTTKKIIGGTISHSHKSLRSQSSSRKRVISMDSTTALNNGGQQATKYNLPLSHSSKKGTGTHSGHLTPDLSSYNNNGNKPHQQKAHKFLSNQAAGAGARHHLKPQGNIVIQQQQQQNSSTSGPATASSGGGAMSQHQANLKSSQGNRRHSSILKGEHQGKQMIFINQDNKVAAAQAQIARFGKNQQQDQTRYQNQSPDLANEQDSMCSSSRRGANNLVFVDGGTGGGSQKPKSKARQLSEKRPSDERKKEQKPSQYNTDKKGTKHLEHLEDADDDYNLGQRELNTRERSSGGGPGSKKQSSSSNKSGSSNVKIQKASAGGGRMAADNDVDIDGADVEVPDDFEINLDNYEGRPSDLSGGGRQNEQERLEQKQLRKQENQRRIDADSINITKEALALGKVPPERIAEQIAESGYTLNPTDAALSPRTREMVGLSNQIRKSFFQKGDAPKTTPEFYRAGKMLGRGAFGKVSLGMHKLSRKLVALKSINKEFMTDEKQKSKVMHEVGILLRLRHKSVVKLYETFETKRHMLLTMELCAGGDLLNYVRKRKKLDEDVSKVIFKQIIEGLGYIHKKRVLHRDIKLDNILLDGKGNVKIADFGVSKLVKPGDVMHEQSGTPAYIAPEILREEGYSGFKADIWSAGVVLYAMLCGTVPFKASNMKELHKMIIKGKYHLKEEVSDDAKSLMKSMLNTDPNSRITISKILQHPWMQLPENPVEIFNQEERDIVKKEFIYNNPKNPNRSEAINEAIEPWDCFTELNLDSINEVLRNESEKSVILAPFNSSLSDFNEDEWAGMDAGLIIRRLFDDAAPLEEKKEMVRFAARCRDQDRQYEINNNGELDNGVYHKFVYSSRDGQPEASSSLDDAKGSIDGLRPMSSRNMNKPGSRENVFKKEIDKRVKEGRRLDSELTGEEDYGEESTDSVIGLAGVAGGPDLALVQTLINFGYPEDYLRFCLSEGDASYCLAAYYLLGEDQQY